MVDVSKAFDYLPREMLVAKFVAYGFDLKSMKLIKKILLERRYDEPLSIYSRFVGMTI